jgi:hypothetical protein
MNRNLIKSCMAALVGLVVSGLANGASFANIPAGTLGNEPQGSPGPYAANYYFDVASPVEVTSLGAFDSGSDGVFLSEIQVAIFNRDTGALMTPVVLFNSADPGTPEGGFSYKNLAAPLFLDAGFKGAIATAGYSGQDSGFEPWYNTTHGVPVASFDDGGGLLANLGWLHYYRPTSDLIYDLSSPLFVAEGLSPYAQGAGSFQYQAVPLPPAVWLFGWAIAAMGIVGRRKLGT